jgi:TatA/E family protein of Tat protein translocase
MFDNPIAIGVVVVLVVLLIAGPKRLPSFGRGLGSGMREFKEGIQGEAKEFKEGITGESKHDEGVQLSQPARPTADHAAPRRESDPLA